MEPMRLDETALEMTTGGEAITLTAIMACLAIGIVAVVVYKMFFSSQGETKLPGGFSFQWK